MGRIREQVVQALDFMPVHRSDFRRRRTLNLDLLLEDSRAIQEIDAGTLDFILMGYRYYWVFKEELKPFLKKEMSPPGLEDLLMIGFSALLTRTQIPIPALTHEIVEAASNAFGPFVKSVTNAFLRHVLRERPRIEAALRAQPEKMLGPILSKQLTKKDAARIAGFLQNRPTAGISAFNDQGIFTHYTSEEFLKSPLKLQAMDPGSFAFCEWFATEIKSHFAPASPLTILDACAAPGGKLIALHSLLKKHSYAPKFIAVDAKQARLEILKRNLKRFAIEADVKTELYDWATPYKGDSADVLLLDLPCTGSGTLHTRPDLLLEDLENRYQDLKPLQSQIIRGAQKALKESSLMVVSLCSILPLEIAGISQLLGGLTPQFQSWTGIDTPSEGITAWLVKK